MTVVGKPIIVLNSYQAARDLLEKRSSIYSSRPRMVMQCELCVYSHPKESSDRWTFVTLTLFSSTNSRMGWGDVLSHQRVGPRFRKHRRIIQDQFSDKQISKYVHIQRKEAYATLADLGNTPGDLTKHLKRSALVSFYA